MKVINFRYIFIGLAMLAAAGLALALTPNAKISDQGPKVDLETMIPKQFGAWRMDESLAQPIVDPQLRKVIEATYSQTLSRAYLDPHGYRVMLSLAYGGSYGKGMQTHRPEICYPAQGFNIQREMPIQTLQTRFGPLSVKRLIASNGSRNEPITYWLVIGDTHTSFGLMMRLAQIRYTITGVIPDGMLVRVSSIDPNEERAFSEQERFIKVLLAVLREPQRMRIMGKASY